MSGALSPTPPLVLAASEQAAARPFLKWVGGKTWLARGYPQALSALTRGNGRYHEAFLGSGALFFQLPGSQPDTPRDAWLSDANPDLINAFRVVRDQPRPLIEQLEALEAAHHADARGSYYRERERYNERERHGLTRTPEFARDRGAHAPGHSDVERAARLIYLNRTGFNGLYRVNRRGLYNVPVGRYVRPRVAFPERILACSQALSASRLEVGSFTRLLETAEAGDQVYLDPPYVPLSATSSFTGYSMGGFGPAEQQELVKVAEALQQRGCRVLLSNSFCPPVSELYRDWSVYAVPVARSVNSRARARGPVDESLICRDQSLIDGLESDLRLARKSA